jgi:hypothetical protein
LGAVAVLMPWAASLRKEEPRRSLQGVTRTDPASHIRWDDWCMAASFPCRAAAVIVSGYDSDRRLEERGT